MQTEREHAFPSQRNGGMMGLKYSRWQRFQTALVEGMPYCKSAGFDVFSTQIESEALARIRRGDCAVVLLGDSLSSGVRKNLAQATRKYCPRARIIEITNRKTDKPEFTDTEEASGP
jgi:hypothetical protein